MEQEIIEVKKKIWKIKTLPKIRTFLWRAVSDALAVADRLQTRGIILDTGCKLCNSNTESINHVLFQCLPALEILQSVNFPPDPSSIRSLCQNIKLALEMMSDVTISETNRRAILWLLWAIWKNRNSIIYAGTQISTEVITRQAIEEATIWTEVNSSATTLASLSLALVIAPRWSPPRTGFVKCNVNANWRNSSSLYGGAWITRDPEGTVLHHARDAFTGAPNRLTAELRCIVWSMKSQIDLGHQEVIFAIDNKEAFAALANVAAWLRYRSIL